MNRPLLLDLFCGAGGCSVGYARAGFDVVGCDIALSRRYPYSCWDDDAMYVLDAFASGRTVRGFRAGDFAAIHASPPCQAYSVATKSTAGAPLLHPDLLGRVRYLLQAIGLPWVIENVEGAPMMPPAIRLCGLMFGLKVFRHRWFESSILLLNQPHPSHHGHRIGVGGMVTVAGGGNSGLRDRASGRMERRRPEDGVAAWRRGMGIDWMTRDELAQAIPPAYTEYVGRQILLYLEATA